jgi:Gram-negative bacterial TonB protein C-terminal
MIDGGFGVPLASLLLLFYDARMKRCLCLFIMSFVFVHLLSASDAAKQQEAIARLEQAVSKTNIFELPSFAMRADVQVEDHGKSVKGTYELLWNGPDQWRERTSVPGYTEVQIGGRGTVWVRRSVDFIPVSIYTIHQALGFGSSVASPQSMSLVQLDLTPRDTITKTSKRKKHGEELTCFEIENEQKHSSEICVDDSSDTVARAPFMFADSNLQPVGAKVFPRLLTLHHGDEVVAKVNISELASPAQFPPDTFAPPSGVSPEAGCMNPSLPNLVKRQQPEYPPTARLQHHQGTVSFDALIGKDGVPRLRKLIESASPDLDASSQQALIQWRYDPAMCNGQPVEVETVLQVNYTLSY